MNVKTDRQARLLKPCQVMRWSMVNLFCIWSALVMGNIGISEASVLNQTNLENGDMAPWQVFVMQNGTVGGAGLPTVVLFETAKGRQGSKTLKFKVGQVRYDPDENPEQGGGLVIQVAADAGTLHLSAHVAVTYRSPKDKRNLAGGLFEWMVNDQIIARHDFGPIENGQVLRHHLKARHPIIAGVYTIRLRITRSFTSHPGQNAPHQYVDDLLVRLSPLS